MRDIKLEDTFRHQFTTRAFATGVPTVLAGTPVLSVLEENNATPITSGVTVSVDRASVVGLNEVTIIATAANGYEIGKSYAIYISIGTVGGVSVIGEVVGHFTIQLAPVNWARVTAPTTAVDLSATDIQLCDTVTTLTGNTAQTGDNFARLGVPAGASVSADIADVPTVAEFNARTLVAASYFDPTADVVANVTLVATTTTNTDMRGTDGAATTLANGTAQAGTATTIQLATAETFADGELEGITVKILSGTGAGQARVIISNVGATDTATIAPNWTTNPSSDSVYELVDGSVNLSVFNLGEVTGSLETSADVADAVFNEDIVADHGTVDTAGLILRALGAVISQRTNNATLNAILGVADTVGTDLPEQTWAETVRILTASTNFNDISVADILTTQMTEAFAADGVAPTLAQALFLIQQILGDFGIAGTTLTVRKIDGVTVAATFTLDDSVNPTDLTRTT